MGRATRSAYDGLRTTARRSGTKRASTRWSAVESVTPLIAALPDGVVVVAFTDTSTGDSEVRFRRFDAEGRPLEPVEVLGNVSRRGRQAPFGLVANAHGDFLIGYDDARGV
jgi:hypothetical protein